MVHARLALPRLLPLLAVACVPAPASVESHASSVIAGAADPAELGFAMSQLERAAVVGQLVTVDGVSYQGCSGTLIGDRAVVAAAHCVVLNQDAWLNGAEPEVVAPDLLAYAVGVDVERPDCLLKAVEVHLHPDVEPTDFGIGHDVSVTIVEGSAIETCPGVVPLSAAREPADELVGELFLQGGFGSTDGTYDFSPLRYWSALELWWTDGIVLTMLDAGLGFPTFGDSGSGVLHRLADGRLASFGVASSGAGTRMDFIALAAETEFLDSVIDNELRCGPIDEIGTCRLESVVRCDASGFVAIDCEAVGARCEPDHDDVPTCVCACDGDAVCDPDCICDADCPCDCDTTGACDDRCACDPGCGAGPPDAGADAGAPDATLDAGPGSDGGPSGGSGGCAMAPDRPMAGWLLLVVIAVPRRRRTA